MSNIEFEPDGRLERFYAIQLSRPEDMHGDSFRLYN